jgi:tRNA G18 (ribose-2'-O)-methylase SpoU
LILPNLNVIDEYKQLSKVEIQRKVEEKTFPFAIMMMQIMGDFNFGTLVRNANAFGAREVFYYGPRKKWDRRGSVGTHHYTPVSFKKIGDYDSIHELKEKYPHFIAMDIIPGESIDMRSHSLKPGSLLIFGEEGCGLPLEILGMCEKTVHIPQRGSVRSINVGTASGVAMYDFMRSYEENYLS